MKLFVLIARLLLGGLFVGHGAQKLFGWFGGYGPDGTGGYLESLGVKPGRQHALAAGAIGDGRRRAARRRAGDAGGRGRDHRRDGDRHPHGAPPNGPWVTENGWEHPAMVIAAVLTIARSARARCRSTPRSGPSARGPGWALAALVAGVGGSALLLRDWERPAPAPEGGGEG